MFELVPLQLLESFLLDYHLGHVLTLLFGLSVLGSVPLGSRKLVAANVIIFGLLFIITPLSTMNDEPIYRFFGIALLLIAPILWAFARE